MSRSGRDSRFRSSGTHTLTPLSPSSLFFLFFFSSRFTTLRCQYIRELYNSFSILFRFSISFRFSSPLKISRVLRYCSFYKSTVTDGIRVQILILIQMTSVMLFFVFFAKRNFNASGFKSCCDSAIDRLHYIRTIIGFILKHFLMSFSGIAIKIVHIVFRRSITKDCNILSTIILNKCSWQPARVFIEHVPKFLTRR